MTVYSCLILLVPLQKLGAQALDSYPCIIRFDYIFADDTLQLFIHNWCHYNIASPQLWQLALNVSWQGGEEKKIYVPNLTKLVSSVTSAGAATQCWHITSTAGPVDLTSCFCVLERSQVLQREREHAGPRTAHWHHLWVTAELYYQDRLFIHTGIRQ
jgi:hypothetical protein